MDATIPPISNTLPLPPGQDYAWLRAEGLRQLQLLSGRVWTDYNDHDPGVTLLEALCFALTDVSNRAALPVPALLGASSDAPGDYPDTFLPAHQAFANHPVTLDDYKKLVLDRFHHLVKNAWVTPLAGSAERPAAPGHYEVHLELFEVLPNEQDPGQAMERENLPSDVLSYLNQHRNLGELFIAITVLKPHAVVVGGHLELAAGATPTQVMAELLWQLDNVLDPALLIETVSQLLDAGVATEDLFAGPVAHHRLSLESRFKPRPLRVDIGQLLKGAKQVGGGHRLVGLQLYAAPTGDAVTEFVAFGADEVGRLDLEASLRRFTVSQQGVPLTLDFSQVLIAYQKLLYAGLRYLPRPDQLRLPAELPERAYAGLGRYDSVQHLLPAIYGVGETGPMLGSSPAGRAYVMQLKGYLLLFDQLLANFCAQLENAGRFFSLTPQPITYYSAPLYEVPYVAPLLPGTGISPDAAWNDDPAAALRWQAYQADTANPYQTKLRKLNDGFASTQQHRNGFLAHLLARFGYTVQLYHGSRLTANPEKDTALAYEHLLRHLGAATYHRAAACVAIPGKQQANESGLEYFLFLLAGLQSLPRRLSQGESLAELEGQTQLNNYTHGQAHPAGYRLLVRGGVTHFAQLYDALANQLEKPALAPLSPTVAYFIPYSGQPAHRWELELVNEPSKHPDPAVAANPVQRLLGYIEQLDQQLERVNVVDHLVLKPYHERGRPAPVATDAEAREAWNFFHCQLTVLLPGYSFRFRPVPGHPPGHPVGSRAFVEDLIRQHAPAHLLVNIVWLDYPTMRQWEGLYDILAPLNDLLSSAGQPELVTLGAAQKRVRQFLEEQLRRAA